MTQPIVLWTLHSWWLGLSMPCCTCSGVWVSCAGDLLDVEARTRTRSLYFPFGSVPMFPRCLSEGPFSLGDPSSSSSSSSRPNAGACDAFSICITLSDDGSLQEVVKLGPSRVRVSHHMLYDEVDADLGMGPGLCQHEDLQLLYEAARLRYDWRHRSMVYRLLNCFAPYVTHIHPCCTRHAHPVSLGVLWPHGLLSGAAWGALVHTLASHGVQRPGKAALAEPMVRATKF